MENNLTWHDKSYYEYIEKEMSDLSKLTTTILRVHGSEHNELYRVHKLFHIVQINLVQQSIREKMDIVPTVKMYNRKPSKEFLDKILEASNELAPMKKETVELLNELRKVTNGYVAPEDGCATYDTTYEKLSDFESTILEHYELERKNFIPKIADEINK